jgi:dTDP-4-dehydrorhamnose 3,5-epimerase
MIFGATSIAGVYLVDVEPHEDHRGLFARTFCEREFAAISSSAHMVQASVSYSRRRGTVRGIHFQQPPSCEAKLVRCIRGRAFDVVVDLRPDSKTYTHHFAVDLDAVSRRAVYIPPGLGHGFQTLEDDTEIFYQMGDYADAKVAAGVRWNDPAFAIKWPLSDVTINQRDASYPDFNAGAFATEFAALEQARTP